MCLFLLPTRFRRKARVKPYGSAGGQRASLPDSDSSSPISAPILRFMATIWRRTAGVSGAGWIAAAAYGAHGLKGLDEPFVKTWDNGTRMHGYHSCVLALVPALNLRMPHVAGGLFLAGTAIFSGSCYAAVLTRDRANGRFA